MKKNAKRMVTVSPSFSTPSRRISIVAGYGLKPNPVSVFGNKSSDKVSSFIITKYIEPDVLLSGK